MRISVNLPATDVNIDDLIYSNELSEYLVITSIYNNGRFITFNTWSHKIKAEYSDNVAIIRRSHENSSD